MKRRVITYSRVSTDEQAKDGYSLESQREALSAHCNYKKWEMVGEYADEGKSARTMKRDALQYTLMLLHDGDAETLLVKYLDRLARNLQDLLSLFSLSEQEGWNIVILDMGGDTVDSKSAFGKLMISVLGAVAQWQSDITSEKTKVGIEAARAAGRQIGTPCVVRDELLDRMVDMHQSGMSFVDIALCLNVEGTLTPRGLPLWHPGTVRNAVAAYLGDKYVPKFRRLRRA